MSNTITIELCAEDRARLDRLTEALERRTCDKCVTAAIDYVKQATPTAEAPTIAQDEPTQAPPTTTPPAEEKATGEEHAPTQTAPTVDRASLRAKVIALSANGLKAQARDIVMSYADTLKDVPDDKVAECYERLVALEG